MELILSNTSPRASGRGFRTPTAEDSMTTIALKTDEMEWQKGSPLYGPQSIYRGEETVALKILSDRRAEGGGLALLVRMRPPQGKLIKIVAIARSDEHIFALADGRTNKAGHKLRYSGD